MRILHTSDWHIGKKWNERDLLADQAAFADWLVDLVEQESIDAVLLSGDVFDRSNPAADAFDLTGETLERLVDTGATVIMISGNHDSAERLRFGAGIARRGGLHTITERRELLAIDGVVRVPRRDGDAHIDVVAIPYLEPSRLHDVAGAERTHQAVIERYLAEVTPTLDDPSRTIVMGHAFVVGGGEERKVASSERPLGVGSSDGVGGAGAVRAEVFDAFGYVALGHLHRPQLVGSDSVVYSGSPLAYSFSEEDPKSVRLITVGDTGITSETIDVGVGRAVRTLTGTLQELLDSAGFADAENAFVRAILTDTTVQLGAMDALRQRFPHILALDHRRAETEQRTAVVRTTDREARSPIDIVDDYVAETFGDDVDEAMTELIHDAVTTALHAQDAS